MPKHSVTDPITDQEVTFAHLVLTGTMNDADAAEAAGLNPNTAAYTKSKPRVRAYMEEHRAAVQKKVIDQEAEGLRNLNLGRDQVLSRLWQLANLSPDQTRGSITGQMKALSMIIAIEGLIPDRRPAAQPKPASPAVAAKIYTSEWLRQQPQAGATAASETVTIAEAESAAPPESLPDSVSPDDNARSYTPYRSPAPDLTSIDEATALPKGVNWVPGAIGSGWADRTIGPSRFPNLSRKFPFTRGR